ncbi:hypothetical protein CIY_06530 [Butyrivibrio fibrisolvens 16/4]|nr:hypothetical protein CIY_06530 [Butyrivibrio fibrisolvens 16/4]
MKTRNNGSRIFMTELMFSILFLSSYQLCVYSVLQLHLPEARMQRK